ncbi:MAG: potassium-transporting ATPase potassium-binding subunit [Gammaproteobacteria bacterium]|jgi:K+-transporting ATPase ATPase A chain|nr:K+-transporting ATPase, subunit [Gammaproteobacteria bacterium]MEA3138844.1 potassium-transporting ATPase potassium-binding subunit [Gammaproteobacteria bacterium]
MSPLVKFVLLAAFVLGLVIVCAKPLGAYIADIMEGRNNFASLLGARFERWIYRISGVKPSEEMSWSRYAIALLVFNLGGALVVYGLQRLQLWLPLNPQHFAAVSADSSFNTAVSFVTNTNWQGYSGESTMGYLVQAAGLAVQNFLSAATGIAVAVALIRGFTRRSSKTIGNFWVDVTRSSLYVLLPLSVVLALALVSQGVIQNVDGYKDATTMEKLNFDNPKLDADGNPLKDEKGNPLTEPATTQTQTLPMGPVASQEAIKELGTNGGGFYNANSSHGFENPTALSNFLEIAAIFLVPFALTYTFGKMVGDTRQGWALMIAMLVLFGALGMTAFVSEQGGNPLIAAQGIDATPSDLQAGGNMEGKETRFGIAASALFTAATTGTSTGAVNNMHDSMTPMGGFVPLFLMQLGELTPGGVGTGIYTILIFAILGVFIAGLMIGRTPEYLGKKIEAREMKLASIFILTTPLVVLLGTAVGVMTLGGTAGVANPGAHGFSEILYAFTSAGNNNGSAFAGLSANTMFYNTALGVAMWLGRFWPIVAALAIAGSLAAKKRIPVTEGTMPTHGALFISLLIGTILLIGVLNYVPALALGPVVEHFILAQSH